MVGAIGVQVAPFWQGPQTHGSLTKNANAHIIIYQKEITLIDSVIYHFKTYREQQTLFTTIRSNILTCFTLCPGVSSRTCTSVYSAT